MVKTRVLGLVAGAVAAAAVAAGCGSDSSGSTSPDANPADAAAIAEASAAGIETRAAILRLAGPQLDGVEFDPNTVAGRDVLLWFWAPW